MNQTSKTAPAGEIFWSRLIPATLIRRYQRFLTDVRLKDGSEITAHGPNSGRMLACCEPERPVYLSCHDNPKRKLKRGSKRAPLLGMMLLLLVLKY